MGTKPCTATVFAVGAEGTEVLAMSWGLGLRWSALESRGFSLDAAVDLFHAASKCCHS